MDELATASGSGDGDISTSSLQTKLTLDLRGTRFSIERETLMNLPESVLLCLFPNGLVLSRQGAGNHYEDDSEADDDEEEVYLVDFDPTCLSYVLQFFKSAQDIFYGTPSAPSKRSILGAQHPSALQAGAELDAYGPGGAGQLGAGGGNPLLTKQAIIVLREELEYFAIPPKPPVGAAQEKGPAKPQPLSQTELNKLKTDCGEALIGRQSIFTALQRNVSKENNMAEQHLIDMLCMSGFNRDDAWGFRAVEPSRCCITSIALVLLKTGITTTEDAAASNGAGGEIQIDQNQLATAQKLLLFWRKPARKCWWDGVDVVVPLVDSAQASTTESGPTSTVDDTLLKAEQSTGGGMTAQEAELLKSGKGTKIRVWARRVWTLELSLI
ncbi:hypothetical protein IE81DRAFT_136024 [Ceraceosorus guamensis]|uniref:Phosphatase activator n=1 Tax=Ceraceosorus guamensis TaxID=1522189 RepID=A0A316VXN2_9BASI|nr:hypothetical protein IE81DRAFT_136024 [Ceraceosorus guamensis]PWN42407.1 hypothetical protein IE81DRAFT_136024 [Ceraceosorus guamensis]